MIRPISFKNSCLSYLCLGCLHEVNDNIGGPNPDNGVCMGCEDGDMFNTGGIGGGFVGG